MNRFPKILIVDQEPRALEELVRALSVAFEARITCLASAREALDIDLVEPHDLAVVEINLPDMDGLAFARHWRELRPRPVLLLSQQPNFSHAIEALRLGAADLFVKPLDLRSVVDAARHWLRESERAEFQRQRYRRLRGLVRRVLRERRELQQRMDLLCRDLVGAHRRLVTRVMDFEKSRV